jgi:hypothetical protein
MAVKKSELYSSLWASCNDLRAGMDVSQYKDYILTLLFVKYVSDKATDNPYDEIKVPEGGSFSDMLKLRGTKNIGEGMDKIIGALAVANSLRGVIDNAHFNDEEKLGKGQEMVDKLTSLLNVFNDKMPDFSKNRADGDDITSLELPGYSRFIPNKEITEKTPTISASPAILIQAISLIYKTLRVTCKAAFPKRTLKASPLIGRPFRI